ncbi:MAG: hypothetical protein OEY28_14775, partial [Nitrospira sp.]|nr:hypothetical protein [Nitrospira sp.]
LTRRELEELLMGAGFRVVSKIDGVTDAAIVGADWDQDPIYQAAVDERLDFEKYTVDEVLRFVGTGKR